MFNIITQASIISIIAIGAHDDKPDYDYADSCELRVYTLLDGVKAETTVYGMSNLPELTVSAARSGHTIHVTAEGSKPYTIRMVNMHAAEAVNGFVVIEGNDSIITPDANASVIEIKF